MKRICLTGPEATGKSTLARELAQHYECSWVPEYARSYLQELGRSYSFKDLDAIAVGQSNKEEAMAQSSSDAIAIFCDTGPEVIWIWSAFKYGKVSPIVENLTRNSHYDHTLLLDVDLPWEADPLRENPDLAERVALLAEYKKLLEELNRPYRLIRGESKDRLRNAITSISSLQ